jgi:vesicle coat complex subunit
VAKLVVSPNSEIKKLVYAYLAHYAEMEPEAALLAINTLKKELSNTNQLARANALRTMSSIRVKIISQLVGLAVKKAATDSSPYVRKTAACAVPKLVRCVLYYLFGFCRPKHDAHSED